MMWTLSHRADPPTVRIANRHYSRQKPGTPQFVPPGSCFVLRCPGAVWVTSWPKQEFTHHEWAGAWVNSMFRKEGSGIASEMIRAAVAATLWHYGEPPGLGMITFIDPLKVEPTYRHGVPVWGYSYMLAGFEEVGQTKSGLLAFQLLPSQMPVAERPKNSQYSLWEVTDGPL